MSEEIKLWRRDLITKLLENGCPVNNVIKVAMEIDDFVNSTFKKHSELSPIERLKILNPQFGDIVWVKYELYVNKLSSKDDRDKIVDGEKELREFLDSINFFDTLKRE